MDGFCGVVRRINFFPHPFGLSLSKPFSYSPFVLRYRRIMVLGVRSQFRCEAKCST